MTHAKRLFQKRYFIIVCKAYYERLRKYKCVFYFKNFCPNSLAQQNVKVRQGLNVP